MSFVKKFQELPASIRRNLIFILVNYFFILFTYPIIRSLATSYFLDAYGAKNAPLSWLYSIVLLAITITWMNRYLNKMGVQRIFGIISGLTLIALILPWLNYFKEFSFFFFVWKEVYIVVLIHSFLAYANSYFKIDDFKNWLGFVAGAGSVGGILGGFLLSGFVKQYGMEFAFVLAAIGIIIPAFLFHFCEKVELIEKDKKNKPLKAIKGIGSYVFIVGVLVTLSQFVINIADFKFHLIFEANIIDKIARTEFLGRMYGIINVFSLVGQILIMPLLMKKLKPTSIHILLPITYFLFAGVGLLVGGAWGIGLTFIYYKGSDYSFFTMAKELLYHPLSNIQKFGAKYITDMFVYRFAKALIALLLYLVQKPVWVDSLLVVFLLLWFISAWFLRKEYLKLNKET